MDEVRDPINVYGNRVLTHRVNISRVDVDVSLRKTITAVNTISVVYENINKIATLGSFRDIHDYLRELRHYIELSTDHCYISALNSDWHLKLFRDADVVGNDSLTWYEMYWESPLHCIYTGNRIPRRGEILEKMTSDEFFAVVISDDDGPLVGLIRINIFLYFVIRFPDLGVRLLEESDTAVNSAIHNINEPVSLTYFYKS